jgi:hypothetical protein
LKSLFSARFEKRVAPMVGEKNNPMLEKKDGRVLTLCGSAVG